MKRNPCSIYLALSNNCLGTFFLIFILICIICIIRTFFTFYSYHISPTVDNIIDGSSQKFHTKSPSIPILIQAMLINSKQSIDHARRLQSNQQSQNGELVFQGSKILNFKKGIELRVTLCNQTQIAVIDLSGPSQTWFAVGMRC